MKITDEMVRAALKAWHDGKGLPTDDMKAALEAAVGHVELVLQPLNWEESLYPEILAVADKWPTEGRYIILADFELTGLSYGRPPQKFSSLSEAKAAAEADYHDLTHARFVLAPVPKTKDIRSAALEEAARLIEDFHIVSSNAETGPYISPRRAGDQNGLAYSQFIRALKGNT